MDVLWRFIETGKFFENGIPRGNTELAYSQGLGGESSKYKARLSFPNYIPDEEIPDSSFAFIRIDEKDYAFVQLQLRTENELLADYETKRAFNQIRYTLLSFDELESIISGGYSVFYEFVLSHPLKDAKDPFLLPVYSKPRSELLSEKIAFTTNI